MEFLKFRIWDGNNKKYDYPEILELNKGLEYEQFTGLHDKDCVEIYEGDVIYLDNWSKDIDYVIWFIEGAFCIANNETKEFVADIHYVQHAGKPRSKVVGNVNFKE